MTLCLEFLTTKIKVHIFTSDLPQRDWADLHVYYRLMNWCIKMKKLIAKYFGSFYSAFPSHLLAQQIGDLYHECIHKGTGRFSHQNILKICAISRLETKEVQEPENQVYLDSNWTLQWFTGDFNDDRIDRSLCPPEWNRKIWNQLYCLRHGWWRKAYIGYMWSHLQMLEIFTSSSLKILQTKPLVIYKAILRSEVKETVKTVCLNELPTQ